VILAADRIRHIGVTKVPWPWVDSLASAKREAEFRFPMTLSTGTAELPALEFHVPVDDTHSLRVLYRTYDAAAEKHEAPDVYEIPWRLEDDDRMREAERLGWEDGHPGVTSQLLRLLRGDTSPWTGLPDGRANGVAHGAQEDYRSAACFDSATVSEERLLAYMPPPANSEPRSATTEFSMPHRGATSDEAGNGGMPSPNPSPKGRGIAGE
jgi:hypothetical protein